MKGLSLRAYARHREELGLPGATLHGVQVAIASGRLRQSIGKDRRIRDAAQADAEWAATTLDHMRPHTGPGSKVAGVEGKAPDLAESRARREAAEAALAEIELAEKQRELLPAADVEHRLVETFSRCKTKLLGVPSRARQQDPALAAPQLALLERLIREALEELSGTNPPARARKVS